MSITNQDFLEWQESFADSILNQVKTNYPAQIVSYDSSTKKASVKILDKILVAEDTVLDIPVLTDIPVQMFVGGGFQIAIPLKEGDTGRLAIFHSDIDEYKSYGGEREVYSRNEFAFHNSMFIPDFHPFNKDVVSNQSNLVIGTSNGLAQFSMTPANEVVVATPVGDITIGEHSVAITVGVAKIEAIDNGDINIGTETIRAQLKTSTGEINIGNEHCSIGLDAIGLITIGNDNVRIVLPV
jgi:hypothetical protein